MADAQQQTQAGAQAGVLDLSDFDKALEASFSPKTDARRDAIKGAVQTLVGQALEAKDLVSGEAVKTIEAIIGQIDKKLTEQLNLILHHEDFRSLEGSWRGLHHLVTHTETDETLKIRVLNVTKKEAAKSLKKFKGAAWDQSPLFKKIYTGEYDQPGGTPYGCLIGDYYFDHTAPDVELLQGMSQIAAAAHCPFLAAAAPGLLGMESWQQLGDPRDLTKIFGTAEYAPWRSFRESDDSRYVGLTCPRFLSRMPYGAKTNPVEEFEFEEDTEGADHNKYVWTNSAYAMGANVTRAFKMFGWCSMIRGVESGGMVDGLPCHTFPTDDGGVDMKCPTEIAVTDRREAELAKNGLIPLSHWKNTDYAVFMGAQSAHKPPAFDNAEATANANLGARLPYMFAVCRFAHYLKCMVRDKIGATMEEKQLQEWLQRWILNYVEEDKDATQDAKARRPLAAASVVVEPDPSNPGYYASKFFLRPHYQLEGLTVSLRLVSKLPSGKG